jgi:hypothetical protein
MNSRSLSVWLAMAALTGCGGASQSVQVNEEVAQREQRNERARSLGDSSGDPEGEARCEVSADRESSEYDTSGDNIPDVRKVFKVMGTPPTVRLVLVCRESDLNADGKKDVVRYYNDEGRPMREEVDRNFDGMIDSDANGIVDLKTFFENGKPQRAEADLAGRSTAAEWKPNRWEYFESNRMVRMGTDIDGDGRVDRWDRDEEFKRQQREEQAAEATGEGGGDADGEESDTMSAQ